MNELIKINYDAEQPTVSARDLHEGLEIETPLKKWIDRMCEYGFESGKDFWTKMSESTGGHPAMDYDISVDMAKQICMIQHTEKGRMYRPYFLDLEKAWNTPEQIMARALRMADKTIEDQKEQIRRMKPKELFADAVSVSHTSILIGDLAKLLKQNGIETGQKRLFEWMRENGYLIKRKGPDWNMPTQKNEGIAEKIRVVMAEDECNDTYGCYRMYQVLKQKYPDDDIPSERTVYRIMEEIGLSHRLKRNPNGITKAERNARKSEDLLKRDFTAERPWEPVYQ